MIKKLRDFLRENNINFKGDIKSFFDLISITEAFLSTDILSLNPKAPEVSEEEIRKAVSSLISYCDIKENKKSFLEERMIKFILKVLFYKYTKNLKQIDTTPKKKEKLEDWQILPPGEMINIDRSKLPKMKYDEEVLKEIEQFKKEFLNG